jgi:dihydroorotase-like cyclic amidohydrolase
MRTLIKGAAVVTMDAAIGDFERADILIDDGTIVQIAPRIDVEAESKGGARARWSDHRPGQRGQRGHRSR